MKLRMPGNFARKTASVSLTMRWLSTFALAMGILLLPVAGTQDSVFAPGAQAVAGNGPGGKGGPPDPGDGGDGGGNAGAGKGGGKGNGGSGPDKGDLYGDMVYLKREENGVPATITVGEGENETDCAIPVAYTGTEWIELPLFGDFGSNPTMNDNPEALGVDPFCLADEGGLESWGIATRLQTRDRSKDQSKDFTGDRDRDRDRLNLLLQIHKSALAASGKGPTLEAEDDSELGLCDVITLCANNTQEVDLGRLSVLRAPARVMDKSRDEIFKVLLKSTGWDSTTLDASGRLTVDGATFDSPLVNLALYREYHKFWQLQDTNQEPNAYIIPGSDGGLYRGDFGPYYGAYMAMAFGLAAGSDKEGSGVDVDVVSRANAILGLPGSEFHIQKGGNYEGFPETLSKVIEGQTHYFIDYGDFSYDRELVYPGAICYIDVTTMTEYQYSSLMDFVFGPDPGLNTGSGINGFAMAANDARRVLAAIHGLGPLAVHWVDPVFTDSGDSCEAD